MRVEGFWFAEIEGLSTRARGGSGLAGTGLAMHSLPGSSFLEGDSTEPPGLVVEFLPLYLPRTFSISMGSFKFMQVTQLSLSTDALESSEVRGSS